MHRKTLQPFFFHVLNINFIMLLCKEQLKVLSFIVGKLREMGHTVLRTETDKTVLQNKKTVQRLVSNI